VSYLIGEGHLNALLYPISFLKTSIEQARQKEERQIKNSAVAHRISRASNEEFRKIFETEKKEIATTKEIENFLN
jgi:hypothetical protein